MPQLLIIPITKIQDLSRKTPELDEFFQKVPLEAIIELIVSYNTPTDLSTAIWEEVESNLSDDELYRINITNIDFMFEFMTEMFYEELYSITDAMDIQFRVYHWLPDSVCLIPVNNPNFNAYHNPPVAI